jgi:ABC-type nickel/cobalt efflux system permease component RcnA
MIQLQTLVVLEMFLLHHQHRVHQAVLVSALVHLQQVAVVVAVVLLVFLVLTLTQLLVQVVQVVQERFLL